MSMSALVQVAAITDALAQWAAIISALVQEAAITHSYLAHRKSSIVSGMLEVYVNHRVRYMLHVVAPIKALCSERYDDWQGKFGPLGLKCCELTGDSQLDDYFELQNANIVMTTPVRQSVEKRQMKF